MSRTRSATVNRLLDTWEQQRKQAGETAVGDTPARPARGQPTARVRVVYASGATQRVECALCRQVVLAAGDGPALAAILFKRRVQREVDFRAG